jgi:hypothetical protein
MAGTCGTHAKSRNPLTHTYFGKPEGDRIKYIYNLAVMV